jgi:hypothetical protein
MKSLKKVVIIYIVLIMTLSLFPKTALGCSAFIITKENIVLVGNNEDSLYPNARMWFLPNEQGKFGRVYFGYDNYDPQGGMNEHGLCFDGFMTDTLKITKSVNKDIYVGNLIDKVMSECKTIHEVIEVYSKYNLKYMENGMLFFADKNGESVIIEGDEFIVKKDNFQIVTNFYQSQIDTNQINCGRFNIAKDMIKKLKDISVKQCCRILNAIHQEGEIATLYSNVYDLKNGKIFLYHFHNYDNPIIIDLKEELKKGENYINISSLFPKSYAAEDFKNLKTKDIEVKKAKRYNKSISPDSYDQFTGIYEIIKGRSKGAKFLIEKINKKMFIEAIGATEKHELLPETNNNFFYLGLYEIDIYFQKDGAKITGLKGKIFGSDFEANKIQ